MNLKTKLLVKISSKMNSSIANLLTKSTHTTILSILCFQIAVGLTFLTHPAQANGPLDQITELNRSVDADSIAKLGSLEKIQAAFENGQIQDIPKRVLDPHNLVGQKLVVMNQEQKPIASFDLNDTTAALPKIISNSIRASVEKGRLVLNSYSGQHIQAKHYLGNFRAVSVVQDKELILVSDTQSNIYAIDVAGVLRTAFQVPVPVFNVFTPVSNKNKLYTADESGQVRLTFNSRGLMPFSESEVASITPSEDKIIPRDEKNQVYMQSGDLVVYLQNTKSRELLGILNRNVILDQVKVGISILANLSFMLALHDLKPTFSEKLDAYINGKTLSENDPVNALLQLIDETSARKAFSQEYKNIVENSDPILSEIIRSTSTPQLKQRIKDIGFIESLKSGQKDQFNIEQWAASFDKIKEQAHQDIDVLEERVQNSEAMFAQSDLISRAAKKMGLKNSLLDNQSEMKGDIANIKEGLRTNNFIQSYRELLKSYFKADTQFTQLESSVLSTSQFKQSTAKLFSNLAGSLNVDNLKRLTKYTLMTTAIAGGAYYAFNDKAAIIATTAVAVANWIYTDYFSPVLKSETYRWPTIYGVLIMMTLIPLAYLSGTILTGILKFIKGLLQPFAKHYPKANRMRANIDNEIKLMDGLDAMQKLTTINSRLYAYLVSSFATIFKLFGQNHWEAAKAGVNPFTNVKKDSRYAKRHNLEQSLNLGFNDISGVFSFKFYNAIAKRMIFFSELFGLSGLTERLKKDSAYYEQQQAFHAAKAQKRKDIIKDIVDDKRKSKVLAWLMASLLLSDKLEIDPATLVLISKNGHPLDSYLKNPDLQKQWSELAETLNLEFYEVLQKDANIDWTVVDKKELRDTYLSAYFKLQDLKQESKTASLLRKLKIKWNKTSNAVIFNVGNWGQKDKDFLLKVVANKFVGKQTYQEFTSDHAMVVAVPAVMGERAQTNDPSVIAHRPGDFLFTNPQHGVDIVYNATIHLFMAAPGRTLVYQSLKPEVDYSYGAVENLNTHASPKEEPFVTASTKWFSNLLDFRNSNLGAYYVKNFVKRFTTMQAPLVTNIPMRWGMTDQTLGESIRAYAYTWTSSELKYAWPWVIIGRGNDMEETRIDDQRTAIEAASIDISRAIQSNNHEQRITAENQLVAMYAKQSRRESGTLVRDLIRASDKIEKNSNQTVNLKLRNVLKAIKLENGREVMLLLTKFLDQVDKEQYNEAKATYTSLILALNEGFDKLDANGLKLLSTELQPELGKLLAQYSLKNPPLYTKVNTLNSWATTTVFGAFLTTYLAIGLMVESFKTEHITWANSALWLSYTLSFYALAFTLTSKYSWEHWIGPVQKQIINKYHNLKMSMHSKKVEAAKPSKYTDLKLISSDKDNMSKNSKANNRIGLKSFTVADNLETVFCADLFIIRALNKHK